MVTLPGINGTVPLGLTEGVVDMFQVVKATEARSYYSISTARCACKLVIMYMHVYSESHIHVTLSHYMCIRERDSHLICT